MSLTWAANDRGEDKCLTSRTVPARFLLEPLPCLAFQKLHKPIYANFSLFVADPLHSGAAYRVLNMVRRCGATLDRETLHTNVYYLHVTNKRSSSRRSQLSDKN